MRSVQTLAAIVVLALLTAPLLAGGRLGSIADHEPANDFAAGAVQIAFPNNNGTNCTRMVSGTLTFSTWFDSDWFRLSLAAGERVCIVATPISGLPNGFGTPGTAVHIYNPALGIILGSQDTGSGITFEPVAGRGSVIRFRPDFAGNYYIGVFAAHGEPGTYQLSIIREVPSCIPWTESANSSPAEADVLDIRNANPIAVTGTTGAGDNDYFALDLAAADIVTATTIPSANAANFNLPDTSIDVSDGVNILGFNASDGTVNWPDYPDSIAGATVFFRAPYDGRFYFNVTSTSPTSGQYTLFMSMVPASQCEGDADGNGVVNFADVTAVLTNFNFICN